MPLLLVGVMPAIDAIQDGGDLTSDGLEARALGIGGLVCQGETAELSLLPLESLDGLAL